MIEIDNVSAHNGIAMLNFGYDERLDKHVYQKKQDSFKKGKRGRKPTNVEGMTEEQKIKRN